MTFKLTNHLVNIEYFSIYSFLSKIMCIYCLLQVHLRCQSHLKLSIGYLMQRAREIMFGLGGGGGPFMQS